MTKKNMIINLLISCRHYIQSYITNILLKFSFIGNKLLEKLENILNTRKLIDPYGREVSYLRVSVTDRCDLRCVYCMSEYMTFLPKKDVLSLEELERICTAFIKLGTKKIRLTGGEPLVRKDLIKLTHKPLIKFVK